MRHALHEPGQRPDHLLLGPGILVPQALAHHREDELALVLQEGLGHLRDGGRQGRNCVHLDIFVFVTKLKQSNAIGFPKN